MWTTEVKFGQLRWNFDIRSKYFNNWGENLDNWGEILTSEVYNFDNWGKHFNNWGDNFYI